MESNVNIHLTPDFSHFVALTLQNRMPWKTLNSLLKDLAPTLNETREIICILLKELETLQSSLQKKEKELLNYQNDSFIAEIPKSNSNSEHHKNTIDEIQEDEQQSSVPENEPIEDEIEILEVVKESMNDEILSDMKEDGKLSETLVNNENEEHDANEAEEFMGEIDNQWYTFVKSTKTVVPDHEAPVQGKVSYPKNKTTSSNGNDKHMTNENEHEADKSMNEIDNEWYTFVANDKKCNSETDVKVEDEEIDVKKAKKKQYQCTFCQKAFQKSSNLKRL